MLGIDVYNQGLKYYNCIDSGCYKEVSNPKEWDTCPECHCKPLIWIFNNGSFARCCCGDNPYSGEFAIQSESIMSYWNRTGGSDYYTEEELKEEWNYYCQTGDRDRFRRFSRELEETGVKIW